MVGHPPSPGAVEAARALMAGPAGPNLHVGFPLAPLTSFRIGGPAALYLEAQGEVDLQSAAHAVAETGLPWVVIGKGSNLLVADRGFPGLVIRLGKGMRWVAREGGRLHAGGAMPLPALAGVALSHGLAGLEFGVAIPASLGGAVRMNAGAHARAMGEVLERIDLFSMADGSGSSVPAAEAGLSYRYSALPEGSVVVGATVSLRPGRREEIRAGMDEARAWRRATQPLAEPNCGSVFKNPPGDHAARLVEESGAKGLRVGGAAVSGKHANFIVASPGATAAEVRDVIARVRERVKERFGIELELEVQLVGDFGETRS